MKKAFLSLGLILLATQMLAQPQFGSRPEDNRTLKEAYKDYFTIGVAVNFRNMQNEAERELVKREYNSVTAENAMKVGSLHPSEGVWNWKEADSIANFCRVNKIPLRGHNLCWHAQFADWMMYDKKGNFVKKEVFYERLRDHIHTVVNRYKDIIYCWDVVNEAISDGGRPGRPGE